MRSNIIQRVNGPNLDKNIPQGSSKGALIMDNTISLYTYISLWLELFKKSFMYIVSDQVTELLFL